jgi:hypothetical protein
MSATIIQLNPPIHVVTPMGEAFARLVVDYGPDLNSVWVCDIFETRRCIHIDSEEIRFGGNAMYDLQHPEIPERSI